MLSPTMRATPALAARDAADGEKNAVVDLDAKWANAVNSVGSNLLQALGPLRGALGIGKGQRINTGQPSGWAATRAGLLRAGLKSVPAAEAQALMAKGWVLVDVRPRADFAAFHAAGSRNAELVRVVEGAGGDLMGALRVAAYSAQGVRAVETNPAFEAEVLALTKDAVGVILACASGGTLKPTTNFPDGQASRSLLAAERLLQAAGAGSAAGVVHLQGGLAAWFEGGLPGEGDAEAWDASQGRMPSVEGPQYEQDAPELKRK